MEKNERKKLEAERRERISNRLVLNFGVLLVAAFVLLYVFKFFESGWSLITSRAMLVVWIVSAIGAVVFYVVGRVKLPKIKNYSAIFLGAFVVSFAYWFATSGWTGLITLRLQQPTRIVLLTAAILGFVEMVVLFFVGRGKHAGLRKYSAAGLGVFLFCIFFWMVTCGYIPGANVRYLTVGVYASMAVYFIILAVVSSIQMRRKIDGR